MIQKVCESKTGLVADDVQAVIELLVQRLMKRTINEVIGFLHADLTARFGEVTRAQCGSHARWPGGQLHIEKFGRPAAPGQRTSANGVEETRIVERRVVDPGHAHVRSTAGRRYEWQVLNVLGK